MKTLDERKAYLKDHGICFRCCSSYTHLARDCKAPIKCTECDSEDHSTALHPGPAPWSSQVSSPSFSHGGEEEEPSSSTPSVSNACTEVCGKGLTARSCSKVCLVQVYPNGKREKAVKMYAMLDDQSNRSLARSEFFEHFHINSNASPYSLKTCAGVIETAGRRADGYQIEPVNGGVSLTLPTLIECNEIPDNRSEIPTPEAARHHPHLKSIAHEIPELDENAHILLLLGRDILRVHKVREQINGPHDSPFALKLDLGWVLIGDVCLGNSHKPSVQSYKTNILDNGRPSLFTPCHSHIRLKEKLNIKDEHGMHHVFKGNSACSADEDPIDHSVFKRTKNDNKLAPSIEDEIFLETMDKEFFQDKNNSWVAPLPFRCPRPLLPNNREQALTRLSSLRRTLRKKPEMRQQFSDFIQKIFDNGHAEPAPPLSVNQECWYLPTFGVYHPKKPDQIRVVFDSSAQHQGLSLNDVLLVGPDLNNSLLGVLIRFRKEPVAITADIQQMFHCFAVREDHRDYLRFLWFRDNDLDKDIVEYRMKVHVFGNSPSPAVAIYGLRRAAEEGGLKHGNDTHHFVERNFYVDDGLKSLPTDSEAVDLLQRTRASLAESNLRLHKIASNSAAVLAAFPPEDHAKGVKDLDLEGEGTPIQRSLGLSWEIARDTFTFQTSDSSKPFTRRGVLSTVNSLYDPLGFAAPVTIQGRFLLRELSKEVDEWDTPLPAERCREWETWRDSLQDLQQLHIRRTYSSMSLSKARYKELCVFSDASTKAIGAVAYLRTITEDGQSDVGFILGKAKLTPQDEPTIPRLELCAAVLAVEMSDLILDEIDIKLDTVTFYCDSKVVLGYIYNERKRFYVYVHNRVQRIRQSTRPEQWHYVPTELNPADHASRSVVASHLQNTTWLTGPSFLYKPPESQPTIQGSFELVCPEADVEIRPQPQVTIAATSIQGKQLTSERFERFSTWNSLLKAIAFLIHVVRSFKSTAANKTGTCTGWHHCQRPDHPDESFQAKIVVLLTVQRAAFSEEYNALKEKRVIPKNSPLAKLNPTLDKNGLLRVGGRLTHAQLDSEERNPVILPGRHHISTLVIRHYHDQVKHQGRLFTEGAVRTAGFWLVGGKRCISSVLHKCLTCRRLRGTAENQKMADLPVERLSTSPPFTYVGLDVFGPFTVTARRTRGGHVHNKRWAVLFTCMSTRAVHIEVIESMDTSSCINALRRFFAIRGPAKQLRSDCGTNFIGASKELEFLKTAKEPDVQQYLSNHACTWEFNPPHASHMGGAWERMIGVVRRILDSMLMQVGSQPLSHEVLCTFMAEISAIINARPLVPISTDPDSPLILTPAMLLTQKVGVPPPPGNFLEGNLFRQQWRQVQNLADKFWYRWRKEYLPTLQTRRKWKETQPDIQEGDLVLLRDTQAARNEWPMALVSSVFPSADGKIRKIQVKVSKEGTTKMFLRPITEVVLLLPKRDQGGS